MDLSNTCFNSQQQSALPFLSPLHEGLTFWQSSPRKPTREALGQWAPLASHPQQSIYWLSVLQERVKWGAQRLRLWKLRRNKNMRNHCCIYTKFIPTNSEHTVTMRTSPLPPGTGQRKERRQKPREPQLCALGLWACFLFFLKHRYGEVIHITTQFTH